MPKKSVAREIDDMAKVVTLTAQSTTHLVAVALHPSQLVSQEIDLSRNCRLVSCYMVQLIDLNWFI